MATRPRLAPCLTALLLAIAAVAPAQASTAPTPASGADGRTGLERFQTRAYFTNHEPVVVDARLDRFTVRVDGAADRTAVAGLLEQLLLKVPGQQATIASIKPTAEGREQGTLLVELTEAMSPVQMATLDKLLTTMLPAGTAHLWPALARGPVAEDGFPAGRAFVDDALIVTAKPGRLDAFLTRMGDKLGLTGVEKARLKDTALVRVGAAADFDAVTASAMLRGDEDLASAEPNLFRELQEKAVADDPLFNDQWHLGRQNADVPGTGEVFADDAWDTTKGDPDVVVYVFDSGTEWEHPDLLANVRQDLMFDPAEDDNDPSPECEASQDGIGESPLCPSNTPFRESHGTSVSGTIAAVGDNQLGVAGVCPQCSLAPVRLLGSATSNSLTIAQSFAKACDPTNDGTGQGAWIINNSWGPGFSLFFPLSRSERDAFQLCREVGRAGKGTVIVFAAGNSTADVASDAYAKDPFVVAVAASTNLDDWASYSNFGEQIDVAGPSLGGTVQQDNFGIVCTDVPGDEGYSVTGNDDGSSMDPDYNPGFSGTSAASPVVAGVAGLVLSANPDLSAEQVRLVLTRTADKIRADKVPWEDIFGQDLEAVFEYDDTRHSIAFGYGRVNAREAVALALNPTELGTVGARCDDVPAGDCPVCSAENVCLATCTSQSDCADGSICNTEIGACELPREGRTDFLAPCNADCTFCVGTLDTEFNPTSICTVECTEDRDCDPACDEGEDCDVDSFDCRNVDDDPNGTRVCTVGDPNAGGPADFGLCFNQNVFAAVLVKSTNGKELCSDICFGDTPGACPYGFHCAEANCECTAGNRFCREYTCFEAGAVGTGQGNFFFPLCVPDAGFADQCETDADCQAGDYCRNGSCAYDDREGCHACQPCDTSADCGGREFCIGTVGGTQPGVCAAACDDGERCPGDSVCQTVTVSNGRFNQELQACLGPGTGFEGAVPSDFCSTDYSCEVACRADVPCPTGQVCQSGACVADPNAGEGEGEGEGDAQSLSGGGLRLGCSATGTSSSSPLFAMLLGLAAVRRRRR